MIDTIKFKVPITQQEFENILKKSSEITKENHVSKAIEFRILNSDVSIGSFDRKVTIRSYNSSYTLLELSLPKFALGSNVELLYPNSIEPTLADIHHCLEDHFGVFPAYKTWTIERLDLCYAWRFDSQTSAEEYLKILKTFDYPRKTKYLYKTSVMWRGRYYSLKFYLKLPEFLKHDYPELVKKHRIALVKKLTELADGTLRFEVTIRKEQLNNIFSSKTVSYTEIVNQEKIEKLLNTYLNNLLTHLDKTVMDDREVMAVLQKSFSNRRSVQLFAFYKLYNSPKLNYRQILKDHYSATTIWRNKRDIAKAGVGLPQFDTSIQKFSLTIPSALVINKESDPRASEDA